MSEKRSKFLQLPSPRGCLRRWPPASGICVGQRSEEGEGGLCRSELRRWPPASGIYVGQRGEEGKGRFVFVGEKGEAELWFFVKRFYV